MSVFKTDALAAALDVRLLIRYIHEMNIPSCRALSMRVGCLVTSKSAGNVFLNNSDPVFFGLIIHLWCAVSTNASN